MLLLSHIHIQRQSLKWCSAKNTWNRMVHTFFCGAMPWSNITATKNWHSASRQNRSKHTSAFIVRRNVQHIRQLWSQCWRPALDLNNWSVMQNSCNQFRIWQPQDWLSASRRSISKSIWSPWVQSQHTKQFWIANCSVGVLQLIRTFNLRCWRAANEW